MGCCICKSDSKADLRSSGSKNGVSRHDNWKVSDRHRKEPTKDAKKPNRSADQRSRSAMNEIAPLQTPQDDKMLLAETQISQAYLRGENPLKTMLREPLLEKISNRNHQPSERKSFETIRDRSPPYFNKPSPSDPRQEPKLIHERDAYQDQLDDNHVFMPCSKFYMSKDEKPLWPIICNVLTSLKQKCEQRSVTFDDLKKVIGTYGECNNDMVNLENLINKPLTLLRIGSNQTLTISQQQAATLLSCAFFCLFPYRIKKSQSRAFDKYPNPNFERLYEKGSPEKIEKLKCLFHYFGRVTDKMPCGKITFQRSALAINDIPRWGESKSPLCKLSLKTDQKIEDIPNVLQVDFANKFIGGGVLGNGSVQEEIRFTICPEMLVSLLVCEVMEANECVFLIGCERYSQYQGYASSFKFVGNYADDTPRDTLNRRGCHLVAIDAILFRDKTTQYEMENVHRELLKAYTGFSPQRERFDLESGIATGNWGCGAHNGDKQLKAIIQLMAASEAGRPLIYAALNDKDLVNSFSDVYKYLQQQGATVGDLYRYLERFADRYAQSSLFEYILRKTVSSLRAQY